MDLQNVLNHDLRFESIHVCLFLSFSLLNRSCFSTLAEVVFRTPRKSLQVATPAAKRRQDSLAMLVGFRTRSELPLTVAGS